MADRSSMGLAPLPVVESRAVRYHDNQLLVKAGLQELADHYRVYPMKIAGSEICFLVQKDISNKAAAVLSEAEAASGKILILKKTGGGWAKVWPAKVDT